MDEDYSVGEEESLFGADHSSVNDTDGSVHVAREDIKLMNVVRAIVILILLTFAFIGANICYVVVIISEGTSFDLGFDQAANKVISDFYADIESKLYLAGSLASQFSASAQSGRWPFVTFSDFQERCAGTIYLSEASSVAVSPLVVSSQRNDWEHYAGLMFPETRKSAPAVTVAQAMGGVYFFPTYRDVKQGIYKFQGSSVASQPVSDNILFPIWQTAPFATNESDTGVIGTMFNLMSNQVREAGIEEMVFRDGCTVSNFLFQDSNGTDFANYSDPRASIYYPIRATADSTSTIVATVQMEFKWATVLNAGYGDENGLLPLVAVIENACGGEQFSFTVTGSAASFLGPGDLHDATVVDYQPLNSSYASFAALLDPHGNIPVDPATACNYKITVYPSKAFRSSFFTSKPDIYRAIVLAVFFIIVIVFVTFDCVVGRRQERVVHAAQRSDAIVRSLFPEKSKICKRLTLKI